RGRPTVGGAGVAPGRGGVLGEGAAPLGRAAKLEGRWAEATGLTGGRLGVLARGAKLGGGRTLGGGALGAGKLAGDGTTGATIGGGALGAGTFVGGREGSEGAARGRFG